MKKHSRRYLSRSLLRLALALAGLSVSLSAHAAIVTYEYTGQTYDYYAYSPYDSLMTITGSFTFDLDATTNLAYLDWKANLISYSVFDGVQTLNSSNSTFQVAQFGTDAGGSIYSWYFQLSPGTTFNTANAVGFRSGVGCYDYVNIDNSPMACSNQGAGTFLGPSTVPIPAAAWLFGSALLGLGAIKRRSA